MSRTAFFGELERREALLLMDSPQIMARSKEPELEGLGTDLSRGRSQGSRQNKGLLSSEVANEGVSRRKMSADRISIEDLGTECDHTFEETL